jgi:hypothetical protein
MHDRLGGVGGNDAFALGAEFTNPGAKFRMAGGRFLRFLFLRVMPPQCLKYGPLLIDLNQETSNVRVEFNKMSRRPRKKRKNPENTIIHEAETEFFYTHWNNTRTESFLTAPQNKALGDQALALSEQIFGKSICPALLVTAEIDQLPKVVNNIICEYVWTSGCFLCNAYENEFFKCVLFARGPCIPTHPNTRIFGCYCERALRMNTSFQCGDLLIWSNYEHPAWTKLTSGKAIHTKSKPMEVKQQKGDAPRPIEPGYSWYLTSTHYFDFDSDKITSKVHFFRNALAVSLLSSLELAQMSLESYGDCDK